jgi:Zn-dependent M28 family amino/carboxypeptidase
MTMPVPWPRFWRSHGCLADHTFHTPLIFTAFTLEEYGFIGSLHFIKNAVKRNETFSGMISLKMLGYKNSALQSQTYPPYLDTEKYPDCGDFIAVVDNEPSAQLTKSLAEGMRRNVPSLKVETLVAGNRGKLQQGAVERSCPVLGRRHSSGDGHRHSIFSQSTLPPTL